jgi:RNA recognition motif-containing protein
MVVYVIPDRGLFVPKPIFVKAPPWGTRLDIFQFNRYGTYHTKQSFVYRIYVGCINYDTREESIKQAFLPFGPIRSITMSWDPLTQVQKVTTH